MSNYQAQEEFMEDLPTSFANKKPFISEDFPYQGEKWITALSPITNENGEIIAVFGIDISMESIAIFQKENVLMLLLMFIIIMPLYFLFTEKKIYKSTRSC